MMASLINIPASPIIQKERTERRQTSHLTDSQMCYSEIPGKQLITSDLSVN